MDFIRLGYCLLLTAINLLTFSWMLILYRKESNNSIVLDVEPVFNKMCSLFGFKNSFQELQKSLLFKIFLGSDSNRYNTVIRMERKSNMGTEDRSGCGIGSEHPALTKAVT